MTRFRCAQPKRNTRVSSDDAWPLKRADGQPWHASAPVRKLAPLMPLAEGHVWRGQFWPSLGVAVLCLAGFALAILAAVAMGAK